MSIPENELLGKFKLPPSNMGDEFYLQPEGTRFRQAIRRKAENGEPLADDSELGPEQREGDKSGTETGSVSQQPA